MITETAKVVAIEESMVTLESEIKSTCSSCHQVDTCGSGQVAKAFPKKTACFKTQSDLSLKVGDLVLIGVEETSMLTTAWQVYMWPLFGLILGAAIGQVSLSNELFKTEIIAIFLAILGGYLGYRLAKFWLRYTNQEQKLHPKILKIVSNSISVTQID